MITGKQLRYGGSVLALLVGCFSASAHAQTGAAAATTTSEDVVVTGTSFRGVAPVGSNLITVGSEEIKKMAATTVTQMMANMPAIEGMGNAGRANASSSNGGPGVAVYIHQLGANGSNSTLVLVDGHRVPHSGVTNYFVNPNNVPAGMIERIEVLAEGASAIYGSDAVAGVINFITRKNFDGFQLSGSYTKIDGSDGYTMSALGGHTWDTGSFVASASYGLENELPNTARPWTNPLVQDERAAAAGLVGPGSSFFGSFNCNPATVRPNAAGNIYPSPTSATSVANNTANATCSNWQYGSIFARDVRLNGMIKVNQEIGEKMTFNADMIYGQRKSSQKQSRGTLTANAFSSAGVVGSGATAYTVGATQANPFYINPPGVTATRQEIRYNFDELLGPGAESQGGDSFLSGHADLVYRMFGDWEANFLVSTGRDDAYAAENLNAVNTGQALLALNGTTQTSGNAAATAIPGYNAIITNPLTAATALDVWNPAATNRTSAAVRAGLIDPTNINHGVYSLTQFRVGAQGSVFEMPAGPLRVAFGLEMLNTQIYQYGTRPLNVANAGVASRLFQYHFNRKDLAQFVETQIPIVSQEMGVPLIQKFDINVALRHDDYSDFGETTNPKGSFTWQIIDGLKIRGNASTSFVAPPLNLVGGKAGLANFSNVSGGGPQGTNVPVSFYPLVTQMGIAGCTAASVSCNISTLQGINSSVGDASAIAQKGKGFSIGADWDPSFIPGLSLQATFWDTQLVGGMTAPQFGARVTTASLANALTFYPACATPAEIAAFASQAPQNSVFPACVQFTYRSDTSNYLTYYAQGVDFNVAYRLETDFGTLRADYVLSELTKFDEGFAYKMAPTPDQTFSALDTNGFASAFPSISTNMRGHLGWEIGSFVADVYANYTGPYKNVNANSVIPTQSNAAGVYAGVGGDPVDSNLTFDLHFGYDIAQDNGALSQTQISLAVKNVGDKLPPYWNSASGYDNLVANPIGREYKLTLSKRF